LEDESSISGRMACKSSVAEITGKSNASRQISAIKWARDWRWFRPRLHRQSAEAASNTQTRFSNSSINDPTRETR
jgi:hypothetical protein